jgi:hypothetical protein
MVTTSSASQGSCTQECLPRCNAVTLNSFLLKVFIHGPILPSLEVKISYHIYTPSFCSSERYELPISICVACIDVAVSCRVERIRSQYVGSGNRRVSSTHTPPVLRGHRRPRGAPNHSEGAPDDISIPAFALLACASKLEPVNVTGGAEALKVS